MENLTVGGRPLSFPVEVRAARSWLATYVVEAEAARRLIAPTGLEVAEPRPGKALVSLLFVSYADTDLGAYHEFGVTVVVRRHDAPPATARQRSAEVRRSRIGVYVHRLPVDEVFSMDAGREIWGYPKTLLDFEIAPRGRATACTLRDGGTHVLTLEVAQGRWPNPFHATPPTYTFLDETLRVTRWEGKSSGVRVKLRGARLTLGHGEVADELRSLGLPKKPLLSTTTKHMRARFGPAEILRPAPAAAP